MSGAFHTHLAEAVAVNRARRPYYARVTDGRSEAVSRLLISAEVALLPYARLVDRWAARFNRRGIPIVAADFVSMCGVRPAETPPRYAGGLGPHRYRRLQTRLRRARRRLLRLVIGGHLRRACHAAEALLGELAEREAAWDAHLAMTRHLVESAAYAALHGISYARASGDRTLRLTQWLMASQVAAWPAAAWLDGRAQAAHRCGAGLLVNDVPPIPFRREWAAFARTPDGRALPS